MRDRKLATRDVLPENFNALEEFWEFRPCEIKGFDVLSAVYTLRLQGTENPVINSDLVCSLYPVIAVAGIPDTILVRILLVRVRI